MYIRLLPSTAELNVVQGMCEVNETITAESRDGALVLANKYSRGAYHPDVYMFIEFNGKEVQQVVANNVIIGFVEQE